MRWRRSGRRPRSIPTSLEPLETRPVFRAQLDLEGQLVSLGALFQHLAARVEPGDACPVAGATMTIDDDDRIHVAWLTEKQGVPRMLFASSDNHGASFGVPRSFASDEKLVKHAHLVSIAGGMLVVAWDDLNVSSVVKWGILDPGTAKVQLLGSQAGGSFPIVAASRNQLEIVAMQTGNSAIFRAVRRFTVSPRGPVIR